MATYTTPKLEMFVDLTRQHRYRFRRDVPWQVQEYPSLLPPDTSRIGTACIHYRSGWTCLTWRTKDGDGQFLIGEGISSICSMLDELRKVSPHHMPGYPLVLDEHRRELQEGAQKLTAALNAEALARSKSVGPALGESSTSRLADPPDETLR